MLALASLYIFQAPRTQAANGPFNGKIAFTSNRDGDNEIYAMNADGSGQTKLTTSGGGNDLAAWSPDGKKIAFVSFRDGNFEIYKMNADGSGQTRLTNNPALEGQPAWSPDGKKIAFVSNRDGNFEIYKMNADGSAQTRLTNNPAEDLDPAFSSADGKIAFVSNRTGNREIFSMNADGGNQTNLTNNPADDTSPSWSSPDGTRIAFVSNRDGNNEIYAMNGNGSGQTRLTNNSATDDSPSWSPDGKKIAFGSNRDFNFEIYVMNPDGSGQFRLTNNSERDLNPSWQGFFSPETIGVFRPSTGQWLLRNSNSSGPPDITLNFGQPGDLPVTGDWNGDGRTDIGVFRNGTFFLATLKTVFAPGCKLLCIPSTSFDTLPSFTFGQAGDLPIAGDWNADGIDDVGIFRNGTFILRQPGVTLNFPFNFGQAGDSPVAGDWNGDHRDTIGARSGCFFNLRNSISAGPADISHCFGTGADLPVVGDWDGDGVDTLGVLLNTGGAFQFFLSNNFTDTNIPGFAFGQAGDIPVAGDWNGPNTAPNSGVNDPSIGSSQAGQTQAFTTTCSDPDGWHDISTIDFKLARSDGNGNGVPIALWVQFDEGSNLVRFYDPDLQTWSEGVPGANVVLSSRFADLYLAQTSVLGSGPTGISVQITWAVVFKDAAVMNNYKQFLKITDDAGLSTGFDKVGSWNITR
jgi:TolB protein